jgi:SH3-like domain-containing protein
MRRAIAAFCLVLLAGAAAAQSTPSGLPVPRFVSLKFEEVNGRAGPSDQHPILWTYRRRGLPMEVVAETENWRRVRDPEGELVWVHRRVLDGRRTALALADTPLLARPQEGADVRAVAAPGVILTIRGCRDEWRRVAAGDYTGWTRGGTLWGAGCEDGDFEGAEESSLQARLGG